MILLAVLLISLGVSNSLGLSQDSSAPIVAIRGSMTVDQIFYTLSVNFLLYVVLIIVFYMLVRFYLEEETTHKSEFAAFPIDDPSTEELNEETEGMDEKESLVTETFSIESPQPKKRSSFLNINEWGEPEGTKQEVIQRAVFCAVGLNVSFCVWGLVQERMLTQPYDGAFFEFSYGLVFVNRLGGLILSMCLMHYYKVDWVSQSFTIKLQLFQF